MAIRDLLTHTMEYYTAVKRQAHGPSCKLHCAKAAVTNDHTPCESSYRNVHNRSIWSKSKATRGSAGLQFHREVTRDCSGVRVPVGMADMLCSGCGGGCAIPTSLISDT